MAAEYRICFHVHLSSINLDFKELRLVTLYLEVYRKLLVYDIRNSFNDFLCSPLYHIPVQADPSESGQRSSRFYTEPLFDVHTS